MSQFILQCCAAGLTAIATICILERIHVARSKRLLKITDHTKHKAIINWYKTEPEQQLKLAFNTLSKAMRDNPNEVLDTGLIDHLDKLTAKWHDIRRLTDRKGEDECAPETQDNNTP